MINFSIGFICGAFGYLLGPIVAPLSAALKVPGAKNIALGLVAMFLNALEFGIYILAKKLGSLPMEDDATDEAIVIAFVISLFFGFVAGFVSGFTFLISIFNDALIRKAALKVAANRGVVSRVRVLLRGNISETNELLTSDINGRNLIALLRRYLLEPVESESARQLARDIQDWIGRSLMKDVASGLDAKYFASEFREVFLEFKPIVAIVVSEVISEGVTVAGLTVDWSVQLTEEWLYPKQD